MCRGILTLEGQGGALALFHLDDKGAPALLHGLSIEEEEDLKLEHSMWSIIKQPFGIC
ncbi:MAG: hypothetical protein GY822_26615 [Deltaproteobacteria bacterium]|nr:hypothetical protein [Deltaproteobacteria bacterium]